MYYWHKPVWGQGWGTVRLRLRLSFILLWQRMRYAIKENIYTSLWSLSWVVLVAPKNENKYLKLTFADRKQCTSPSRLIPKEGIHIFFLISNMKFNVPIPYSFQKPSYTYAYIPSNFEILSHKIINHILISITRQEAFGPR